MQPESSLLGVTVLGALSAATNIYVIATRYQVGERVARDSVFWSTILCMPVIMAITALFH
ncbi:AEC family transporter [Aestuariimicrobium ganziense]|uniref:AEC family transporter n=1 Tax=Aestuariimicrobium ganziense TaxID=2773677 RepID=UPI002E2ABDE2|nr:AEC family transporter [Aestuariimicrobium ganziense]